MEESYIRGYIVNLLENIYTDSLERLKAISYGIENILESIEQYFDTLEQAQEKAKEIRELVSRADYFVETMEEL